jgi:spermidine/putrescine transport system permease protein
MARDLELVSPGARAARLALGLYGALIYVFLFGPIVLLVLFSFNANRYGAFPITGWTLDWYRTAIGDYQIHDALLTTLRVAVEVTAISTVVGTAAAFPLVRSRLIFRDGIRIAFVLPIMIPGLLIGVSLLVLFTGTLRMQLSTETAVIGQSVYTTPFVILLVAARLQAFDRDLERAASDLGANAFARLRFIVLPLILPAIVGGALVTFTLSLDEFIITYFLIGGHDTLPIYIYTQVKFGITPEVNALAAMLLGASLAILGLAFALPQLLRLGQRTVRFGREPQTRRAKHRAWTGGAIASQTKQLGSATAAGPNRSRSFER